MMLTGPNGSGKTTLLRAIAGFGEITGGSLMLEPMPDGDELSQHCLYVGHHNAIKPQLSVLENITFWAEFGGGDVEAALASFSMAPIKDVPVAMLSAGQRRRVGLSRLALEKKPIWLLDEPATSLDKASVQTLSHLMQAHLDDGGMLIAASHTNFDITLSQNLELGRRHE
jgi:heme exporter protein A